MQRVPSSPDQRTVAVYVIHKHGYYWTGSHHDNGVWWNQHQHAYRFDEASEAQKVCNELNKIRYVWIPDKVAKVRKRTIRLKIKSSKSHQRW